MTYFRHCLTKMAHIHFPATKDYKKRIVQLGENPKNVFNVGGLGVDAIKKYKPYTKKKIENKLNFKFKKYFGYLSSFKHLMKKVRREIFRNY